MEGVSIQKIAAQDVDLVLPLVKSMLNYQATLDASYLKSFDEIGSDNVRDHMINLLRDENTQILCAKNDGKVLGYVLCRVDLASPVSRPGKIGKVIDVFVISEERGKGIGIALLNAAVEWFKSENISRVELDVYSKNADAVSTWQKSGFQEFRKTMYKEL